jgi:hypothetical protein
VSSLNAPTLEKGRPEATPGRPGPVRGILVQLGQAIFPGAPQRNRTPRRRLLERVATTLAAPAAVLVVALRLPVDRWDSLWAEDGSFFLQQGLDQPLWQSFAQPYAGYLNVFPRLSSAVVTTLPLAAAGVAYTLLAAVAVGWVAWTVWSSSAGLLTSPWLRAVLASAVVLIPAGALEATGNVSNSHFFLVFGAYWALVGRPRSLVATMSANGLVLMATLTDPISLGLLPLAVLRLACLRGWRDRSVGLTYAAGMLVQLLVVLSTERPSGSSPALSEIVFAYGFRVVSPSFLGLSPTQGLVTDARTEVVGYVVALVAALLTGGFALARGLRLPLAAVALASAAFWVVNALFSLNGGYPPTGDGRLILDAASRYTIIPSLLLLSAWVLAAEGALRRAAPRVRPLLLVLAAAPVVAFGITDFRPDYPVRPDLTPWSELVQQATEGCTASPTVEPPPAVIPPGGGWRVLLECTDLT